MVHSISEGKYNLQNALCIQLGIAAEHKRVN